SSSAYSHPRDFHSFPTRRSSDLIVAPDGLIAIVYLIRDAMAFLAISVATWIMAHWEHRKLIDYGLPGKNALGWKFWEGAAFGYRSEEHTSELQSLRHLVCRLLLE